jgi:acylphosphatase
MSGDAQAGRDMTRRHVIIRGRVQGVGFRAWTEHVALQRSLTGWVRNRRDGSVEAVFAGEANAVEAMLADCRRGPAGARVDQVDEQRDGDGGGDMPDPLQVGRRFLVLPTL